jgi:hypothetical protein
MTSEDLRGAYRALQTGGSEQCPTDEELAALVAGEAAPPRREDLADHVVACRRCTESTGILLDVHRQASTARAVVFGRRRWFSLAAAAAALAIIGLLIPRPAGRPASSDRGLPARPAGLVPADGAELAAPPDHFAWPAQPQAEAYRLRIYRDGGDLAWEIRGTAPAADAPPAARSAFAADGSYYWAVEIEGPVGQPRLGPFSFRIAARP